MCILLWNCVGILVRHALGFHSLFFDSYKKPSDRITKGDTNRLAKGLSSGKFNIYHTYITYLYIFILHTYTYICSRHAYAIYFTGVFVFCFYMYFCTDRIEDSDGI